MDKEDINFLQDLAEEMRRISPDYNAEADELENIVFREMKEEMIQMIDIMADFMSIGCWGYYEDWRNLEIAEVE